MALVRSTEKSFADPSVKMAEGTYKLITPNVECVLSSDDPKIASRRYSLTATCSMFNLPSFRLDPVRGKPQHALITITAMLGDSFVVETCTAARRRVRSASKEILETVASLGNARPCPTQVTPSRMDGGEFPS